MISDPDLDYDEGDPEQDWNIPADEVKGLQVEYFNGQLTSQMKELGYCYLFFFKP